MTSSWSFILHLPEYLYVNYVRVGPAQVEFCASQKWVYRVIHKSLWDFRPVGYSSRDGHAEGERVNRGTGTPSFCPTLQVLDMSTLLCLSWSLSSRVRKIQKNIRITLYTWSNIRVYKLNSSWNLNSKITGTWLPAAWLPHRFAIAQQYSSATSIWLHFHFGKE